MNRSLGIEPPAGYTVFATHAENGWVLWVPPANADIPTRLQRYQFINQGANLVGRYGPPPCASAGPAVQDPDKPYSVYTSDVQNDFSPFGLEPTEPYIPQFIAMWCSYVTAIAQQYQWTQIEIGNVVNVRLADLLVSLRFVDGENPGDYVGVMATINATVRQRCELAGWQFAPATTSPVREPKAAVKTVNQ